MTCDSAAAAVVSSKVAVNCLFELHVFPCHLTGFSEMTEFSYENKKALVHNLNKRTTNVENLEAFKRMK